MTDYKETLNLPKTDFSMKANLPEREPKFLAYWREIDLYDQLREQMASSPKFILHDGPPYANGPIHLGTALNKILKDIVIKAKTFSGFDAPFIPGWDCHGLPIELNVEKKHGKVGEKLSVHEFRAACRDYAASQVTIQKADFERLGVIGKWHDPYLTMHPGFEANAVRALSMIVAKGHLHRGQKPVHWCTACQSALAEAEVEYKDKTSPAIDVAFEVIDVKSLLNKFNLDLPIKNIIVPIWTTTPWTLPANEAISIHPEFSYRLIHTSIHNHEYYFIIAAELIDSVMKRLNVAAYSVLAEVLGSELEHVICQHPFLNRQVPVILGSHVTIETGTGAVHTAPAHGQDDYIMGCEYQLPMNNLVNEQGCFSENTPIVTGLFVFKANSIIIDILKNSGHLLHYENIQHSYPHCWRHKTPLIFRATSQWFISMSQQKLRDSALSVIPEVKWIPSWGQQRITKMIEARPDWCISRQRSWGIPITIFVHRETGELHPNTAVLMEKAALLIEQEGIDAWYTCDAKDFIGDDACCYDKVTDVLDVWFDSGVTHACVLAIRPELSIPADLYLEGSDQHRGWFQSSLLTAVAMRNQAPFRSVLTHGYVVDAQGRKMSKSIGNTILPAEVVKKWGADVLRLWAASMDHTNDISVSDEILTRVADAYRRIRNTMRFLLSNLFDFNPEDDLVDAEKLMTLDAWIVGRAQQLQREIAEAFDAYQFPLIYQKIHNFCTVELGSFYLDIIKDRLYTSAKNGLSRRSSQTALYYLVESMVRWLAPLMSFTAEEVWQHMPGKRNQSVFLNRWFDAFPILPKQDEIFWEWLIQVRNDVNKVLEAYRASGRIGSALDAEVILYGDETVFSRLQCLGNELRFVLITSDACILPLPEKHCAEAAATVPNLWIEVKISHHPKCVRCWQKRADVNFDEVHEGLCARCVSNVYQAGEERYFA